MKSFGDITARESFSSISSTKWEWPIRPCAASWASPKRLAAPQGTGFSRMGGNKGMLKALPLAKLPQRLEV